MAAPAGCILHRYRRPPDGSADPALPAFASLAHTPDGVWSDGSSSVGASRLLPPPLPRVLLRDGWDLIENRVDQPAPLPFDLHHVEGQDGLIVLVELEAAPRRCDLCDRSLKVVPHLFFIF